MSELHIDAQGNISNLYEMDIENNPERAVNEVNATQPAPAAPKPIRQGFNLEQLRAMSSNANRSVSVPLKNPTVTDSEKKPEPVPTPTVNVEPVKEPEPIQVVKEEPIVPTPAHEPVVEEKEELLPEPAVTVEPPIEPAVKVEEEPVVVEEPEEPAPIEEMNLLSEPVVEQTAAPIASSTAKVLTIVSNEEIAKMVNSTTQNIWAWVTKVVTKKPSWVSYGGTIMESKDIPGLRLYNCHKSGKNSFVVTVGAGEKFSGVSVDNNKPSGDCSTMLSSDGYYINYGSIVSATACMTEFPTYGI